MKEPSRPKVFYGWYMVVGAALGYLLTGGPFYYGFGAVFNPIRNDFGWSAAVTAGAFTMYQLQSGLLAPFNGMLVDRIGPRRIMFAGMFLLGLGFLLMSWAQSVFTFYFAFLVAGVGFTAGPGNGMTAVAFWFIRKRSRAIGLAMVGGGLAGISAPVLRVLIERYEWRGALLITGLFIWAVGFPIAAIMRDKPEQYGLSPDGDPAKATASDLRSSPATETEPAVTWKEAVRTRTFWLLAMASGLGMFATGATTVLVIPHLENVGINPRIAALAITMITVTSIIGRLSGGWLGDRFDKRYVYAAGLALQAAGVLLLATVQSVWMIVAFLALYGPGYGITIPARPAVIGAAFGRKAFGAIQGSMSGVMTLVTMPGPVIGGLIYDITDSFTLAFILFGIVTAVGIPCVLLIRRVSLGTPISASR